MIVHELIAQNAGDSALYELSEIVSSLTLTEKLNDGASKLEIGYAKNNKLKLLNACTVRHSYNEQSTFYGKISKHNQSQGHDLSCVAFDQLKRAKAKDTLIIKNMTLTDVVKRMCTRLGFRMGYIADTKYKLPAAIRDNKSWLDIVSRAISDTLVGTGKKYRLADEAGYVTLRSLDDLKTDLVLGDGSLAYGYNYESSSEELYNYIKVVSDNTTTGKRDVYIAKDSASIAKYDLLMYFDKVDDNVPQSQAKARANSLLSLYNRETEKLNLDCIGDMRVHAGTSFYCCISDIDVNFRVICKKVAHKFLPVHTMSVEVYMA